MVSTSQSGQINNGARLTYLIIPSMRRDTSNRSWSPGRGVMRPYRSGKNLSYVGGTSTEGEGGQGATDVAAR